MKTTKESRNSFRATIERSRFPRIDDGVIIVLMDDIDTLKAALEMVEWLSIAYGMGDSEYACPWCLNMADKGHAPDCPRQLALKEGE